MPVIHRFGWLLTSALPMGLFEGLKASRWTDRLSVRWMAYYYGLTVLMPFGMVLAAGLWGSVLATLVVLGALGWVVYRRGTSAEKPSAGKTRNDARHTEPPEVALPEGIPTNAWNYFSRNSRSFSFAARGFRPEERRQVSLIYAFCRLTDDLVDKTDQRIDVTEQQLDAWLALSRAAYDGRPSGLPWLDEIMQATRASGAPFDLIAALGEGVRMDLGPVELQSVDDLDLYAYR